MRNGYTNTTPIDSAHLAFESIESAGGVRELLAQRRGTIEGRAAAVCEGDDPNKAFTVVFQFSDSPDTITGRAVTMTRSYSAIRMQHSDFRLAEARQGMFGCRRP